jgi:hypothetical protein
LFFPVLCHNSSPTNHQTNHQTTALQVARDSFLARYDPRHFPEPEAGDTSRIREFMRLKYVQRQWYSPPKIAEAPSTSSTIAYKVSLSFSLSLYLCACIIGTVVDVLRFASFSLYQLICTL